MVRFLTSLLVLLAWTGFSSAQTPVKIGMITTLSTPGGYLGEDMRDGFKLAIEQGDGKLDGVPVDLLVADDGLNPTTAKTLAERMLQRDRVRIFTGNILISLTAVRQLIEEVQLVRID
jgi:branched-chain amino acid transport system substrate-binding protein